MTALNYLSRSDVESLEMLLIEVLDVLEATLAEKQAGQVEMPPKTGVHPREDAFLHAMPAYLAGSDAVGIKWIAGYPTNAAKGIPYLHGLAILSEAETGRPLSVMDATWITDARTAAASVLGIRRLAGDAPRTLAIVGCGRQGQFHLQLLEQVYPELAEIRLYDPVPAAVRRLVQAPGGTGGRVAAASVAEAIADADVVVTAAPIVRAPEPTVPLAGLRPDAVVCAIDFDASVHGDVAATASPFVVDDRAQYLYYRDHGYFGSYPDDPIELTDLAAAPQAQRRDGVPALYAPLGVAVWDVAVAARLHERARERGVGTALAL